MSSKLPTFRQWLSEDDTGETAAAGMRSAAGIISSVLSTWKGQEEQEEKKRLRLFKKLPDDTQRKIVDAVETTLRQHSGKLGTPLRTDLLGAITNTRGELRAIHATLTMIGMMLIDVQHQFVTYADMRYDFDGARALYSQGEQVKNGQLKIIQVTQKMQELFTTRFSQNFIVINSDTAAFIKDKSYRWLVEQIGKLNNPTDRNEYIKTVSSALLTLALDIKNGVENYTTLMKGKSLRGDEEGSK